jgi:hypothetical protein
MKHGLPCFQSSLLHLSFKMNVVPYFTQLQYGNRCSRTVTPDYSTIEILFGAQPVEVLQELYTK